MNNITRTSKEKLPDWLRRWYCLKGEPRFREAADEIERLQRELAKFQKANAELALSLTNEPPAGADELLEAYDAAWIEDQQIGMSPSGTVTISVLTRAKERFNKARAAVLAAMRPPQPPDPDAAWFAEFEKVKGMHTVKCALRVAAENRAAPTACSCSTKSEGERLREIESLMDAKPGTPEGARLDALVDEQERSEADWLSRPAGGGVAEQPAPVGEASVAPQPTCAKCGATVRVLEVEANGWIRLEQHKCTAGEPSDARLERLEAFRDMILAGCTDELYCGPHPSDLWSTLIGECQPCKGSGVVRDANDEIVDCAACGSSGVAETKSESCSECRKPLPPLAEWSMPACPECAEKAEKTKSACLVETVEGKPLERCAQYPNCPCGGPSGETSEGIDMLAALKERLAVPKGHFCRGIVDRFTCHNCGRHYDEHTHTDEASTCPTPSEEESR